MPPNQNYCLDDLYLSTLGDESGKFKGVFGPVTNPSDFLTCSFGTPVEWDGVWQVLEYLGSYLMCYVRISACEHIVYLYTKISQGIRRIELKSQ